MGNVRISYRVGQEVFSAECDLAAAVQMLAGLIDREDVRDAHLAWVRK